MILYRIVKGHFPDTDFRIVHPRVPERIFQEEDKVTPRICLAKSLDGCLTALSPSLIGIELLMDTIRDVPDGPCAKQEVQRRLRFMQIPYTILEFDVDPNSKTVWMTNKVAQHVPDAFHTGECWLLVPATPVRIQRLWLVAGDIVESRLLVDGRSWRYAELKNSIWSQKAANASLDLVGKLYVLAKTQLLFEKEGEE